MKICVLGAGVIGLTTAWWLAEGGHDVVIVDRHDSTGADASAANGGQLSYAFVAPLASPATLEEADRPYGVNPSIPPCSPGACDSCSPAALPSCGRPLQRNSRSPP